DGTKGPPCEGSPGLERPTTPRFMMCGWWVADKITRHPPLIAAERADAVLQVFHARISERRCRIRHATERVGQFGNALAMTVGGTWCPAAPTGDCVVNGPVRVGDPVVQVALSYLGEVDAKVQHVSPIGVAVQGVYSRTGAEARYNEPVSGGRAGGAVMFLVRA